MPISNTELAQRIQDTTDWWQSFVKEQIQWLVSTSPTIVLHDPVTGAAVTVKTPHGLQQLFDDLIGPANSQLTLLQETLEEAQELLADAEAAVSALEAFRTEIQGYVSQAAASASTANTHKNAAAISATNAATSATNAASSATAASGSATAAAGSATTAGTHATNASNSATTATTKATQAGNSATAAATSATNASNSAIAAAAYAAEARDYRARTWYTGTLPPTYPLAGNPVMVDGDLFLNTSEGDVYEFDLPTTGWSKIADLSGPVGGQGEQGVQGPVGVRWRGPWTVGMVLLERDIVSCDGSSYISKGSHTASAANRPFTGIGWESFWDYVAQVATGLPDGSVTTAKLANAAVTMAKTNFASLQTHPVFGVPSFVATAQAIWNKTIYSDYITVINTEIDPETSERSLGSIQVGPLGLTFVDTMDENPALFLGNVRGNDPAKIHHVAGHDALVLKSNLDVDTMSLGGKLAFSNGVTVLTDSDFRVLSGVNSISGMPGVSKTLTWNGLGRLGLGTSSPAEVLDVAGNSLFQGATESRGIAKIRPTTSLGNAIANSLVTEDSILTSANSTPGFHATRWYRRATGAAATSVALEIGRWDSASLATPLSLLSFESDGVAIRVGATERFKVTGTAAAYNGNVIWHAGNHGIGSGLHSDLLDGQHGAYYADIPARLGFTPVNRAGGSVTGVLKFDNPASDTNVMFLAGATKAMTWNYSTVSGTFPAGLMTCQRRTGADGFEAVLYSVDPSTGHFAFSSDPGYVSTYSAVARVSVQGNVIVNGQIAANQYVGRHNSLNTVTTIAQLDLAAYNSFALTLTVGTPCSLALVNAPTAPCDFRFSVTSPAAGAIPAITWPSTFRWTNNVAVPPSATNGRTHVYRGFWDGTYCWVSCDVQNAAK